MFTTRAVAATVLCSVAVHASLVWWWWSQRTRVKHKDNNEDKKDNSEEHKDEFQVLGPSLPIKDVLHMQFEACDVDQAVLQSSEETALAKQTTQNAQELFGSF